MLVVQHNIFLGVLFCENHQYKRENVGIQNKKLVVEMVIRTCGKANVFGFYVLRFCLF